MPTAFVLPLLAYGAFIALGLPDTVLGVAWSELRVAFGLSQSAVGALLLAVTCGYFCSGLLAGIIIDVLGVGGLLTASSGLVTLSLVGYSLAPTWASFFPIGLAVGVGSGAIDAGLNEYAARHFSARALNWLHACWGIGASVGPLVMTHAIVTGHGYRSGYAWIAAMLASMTGAFLITRRWWDGSVPFTANGGAATTANGGAATTANGGAVTTANGGAATATSKALARGGGAHSAWRSGRVWLQMAVFLIYTGTEASIGQWAFTWMREVQGLSVETSGNFTAAYWASLTIGRFLLGTLVDRVGPDRLLRGSSVAGVLGGLLFVAASGRVSLLGLLTLGLALAPFFPTLMARTPARVGSEIARYSVGMQVSASTLGASLLPASIGMLVGETRVEIIGIALVALVLALMIVHEALLVGTRHAPNNDSQ